MPGNLTHWLERIDLGEFARIFESQQVQFDDLVELTDADLRELGIPLGPRKRLLRAIDTLRAASGSATDLNGEASSTEPERRQLTVMFCDLVGSTELSTRLDPEELREIIAACHDAWKISIERYTGFIARYMGDGVLAYFGYPHAHEDDPEFAVRAGLDIVSSISAVEAEVGSSLGAELRVRIGIATGPVVVGDLIGEGASAESAVIGETPNLAARLQAIAKPDSVIISSGTHTLVAGRFHCKDFGLHNLKGIRDEVQCWQPTSLRKSESRFEINRPDKLTRLLGRDEELSILKTRWQRAKASEGQLVLISGEPGIGKSRLVKATNEFLECQPGARYHYQCSPMHSDSALYPVIVQIEGAAGIMSVDSAEIKLKKLNLLLQAESDPAPQMSQALSALLSISGVEKFSDIEPDPKKRKSRIFDAIIEQIENAATKEPVICIFEDIHWIDPSTMELLERLVERFQSLPILVLVTYRTEISPPWAGQANTTSIALSRMSARDIVEMATRVAYGKLLPDEILEQIIAKTDGIPLFVEELVRTVIESELIEERDDRYVLSGPIPPLAIPATLQDSLTARLDRLSGVKHIAQLGAVIGRSFDYPLLSAVADLDSNELNDALTRLEESGLIFRRGSPPASSYTFKHALVRDSAYQSLLKNPRQRYHQRIARALENEFPELVKIDPALLALHYTEAGLTDMAIKYWSRAGERALESSAYLEAINSLECALALLSRSVEDADKISREISIQLMLAASRLQGHGQASDEALASYTRARDLCQQNGTPEQRFRAQWGMHFVNMIQGNLIQSRDLGLELVPMAEKIGDPDLLLEAHHVQWAATLATGQIEDCITHLEYAIPRYRKDQHHRLTFDFGGHDLGVCALNLKTLAKWLQGAPSEARKLSLQSLELAESLTHPFTLFESHLNVGQLRMWEKDVEAQTELALRFHEFVEPGKLPRVHEEAITTLYGATMVESGRISEGMEILNKSMPELAGVIGPWLFPVDSVYADGLAQSGRPGKGIDHIKSVFKIVERGGVHWWDAEFYRVYGEILLRQGDAAEAVNNFQAALDCARSQKNRFLELRVAMSLGRIGDNEIVDLKVRPCLAAAIDAYGKDEKMADLNEARILLDQLGIDSGIQPLKNNR